MRKFYRILPLACLAAAVAFGEALAAAPGKDLGSGEEAQAPYEEVNAELNDKLGVSKKRQGEIQDLRLKERIKEIRKDTLRPDSR